jgi:hypothetical protein
MDQVNYPDAAHKAVGVAAVLPLSQFNFGGVAFILHTIIHD